MKVSSDCSVVEIDVLYHSPQRNGLHSRHWNSICRTDQVGALREEARLRTGMNKDCG